MAEPILNTTSSITDYFKSIGLPSDFSTRQTVFNNLGLNKTLGQYVGSSNQNPNFLKTVSGYDPSVLQQALKGPVAGTDKVDITNLPEVNPNQIPPTTALDTAGGASNVPVSASDTLKTLGISAPPSPEDI